MPSLRTYDYLLTGPTGQVGRYLLRLLTQLGSVAVVMRRCSVQAAWTELETLGLDMKSSNLHIILGDLNTCELPSARHIVNAAGFTSFAGRPTDYWKSNIMVAVRLAHHARRIGATFHQLSSVAVAEFRSDVLTEVKEAVPDEHQLLYSTSKVFVELAVSSILPTTRIFRIGDVVPPICNFDRDWRKTHWLPILFRCGKQGFDYAPHTYKVWLGDTSEVAKAIIHLMDAPGHRHHVLGNPYSWATFRKNAMSEGVSSPGLAKWMTDIILHGPEADMVDDTATRLVLAKGGFTWSKLNDNYWRSFAERSVQG